MRKALLALPIAGALTLGAGSAVALARAAASNGADDMHDRVGSMDMGSMAVGSMAAMHGDGSMPMAGAAMEEMHSLMHEQVGESMPAEMTEACDALHAEMTAGGDASGAGLPAAQNHSAHHPDD